MRLSWLAVALVALTIPLLAEQTDPSGWQYDATVSEHLSDRDAPTAADINAINELLSNMVKSWNQHDLAGYMSAYWSSPKLLLVINNEQIQGWEALNQAYTRGFPNPTQMGQTKDTRIQIRITKPDLALARTTWTMVYPNSDAQLVGNTTLNLQKLDTAWKIVGGYTTYVKSTSRGWEYDSIVPNRSPSASSPEQDEVKAVSDLLLKMLDRWNAHDIAGYLSVFWNSPQLLVILQEEQFQGWQSLSEMYKTGYPDPADMGHTQPSRIQIKLLTPTVANAVTWWTVTFPSSKQRVVGNTTMDLQKFTDGWKVVLAHSSFVEP